MSGGGEQRAQLVDEVSPTSCPPAVSGFSPDTATETLGVGLGVGTMGTSQTRLGLTPEGQGKCQSKASIVERRSGALVGITVSCFSWAP